MQRKNQDRHLNHRKEERSDLRLERQGFVQVEEDPGERKEEKGRGDWGEKNQKETRCAFESLSM